MNFIIFMACSGDACSMITERTPELLTFGVIGVILILIGLLTNIVYAVYVKCPQRSVYNSICWNDIKPNEDNTFLGFLFVLLGIALVFVPLFVGLFYGVYKFIITL